MTFERHFTVGDFGSVKALAVAITVGSRVDSNSLVVHAGLLYRAKNGSQIEFAEVQTDQRLVTGKPLHQFIYWVEPTIPLPRLRAIASWLRAAVLKNRDVRYGFAHSENSRFEGDTLKLDAAQVGLSCATFVATVFGTAQCPLIDWATWPIPSGEDFAFRDWMLGKLKGADGAYLDRLNSERNAPRLRGEEIAAAAAQYPGAQSYEAVQDLSAAASERILAIEPSVLAELARIRNERTAAGTADDTSR